MVDSQTNTAGVHGTFSIDAAGNWSYARTADLNAMNAGDVLSDSFTAVSLDGTASQTVSITINGLHDAAIITGETTGSMTEDDAGTIGALTVSDVDNGQAAFVPQTNVAGSYGTFNIDAAGNWSCVRTADLQSLSVGESASDSFNVVSLDGTASQLIAITITGENDAPMISGVTSDHNTVDDASASGLVSIGGSFRDIDTSDSRTATVNWGTERLNR
ncbi:MAG: VCBS domain-containing protein [Planctomycetaceae bacterium]